METTAIAAPATKLHGVRLWRDSFNKLHLELADGTTVSGVAVASPFPLSAPHRCIFFYDEEGEELGLIGDLAELDLSSRALLREELALEHLTTLILRIVEVTGHRGVTTWELETERGPHTVHVKRRSDIRTLPAGRVLFTDVNGMRYEIRDMEALDDNSVGLLEAKM